MPSFDRGRPHLIAHLRQGAGMARAIWSHPANRRRRMRALANFLGWQFLKHTLKRAVVIRFHQLRLKCYPDSTSTSGALYFSGYPDYWEMKFLQAYLRTGDNFLDIGANSGVYSILACGCIGPDGRVDAFEPAPCTAARIEEQAALNGLSNIHVHRLAVCDRDGEGDFVFWRDDATMHLRRPSEAADGNVKVSTVRLDSFEPSRPYAMGKMDIEGAEPLALAGAANRLAQANPCVWLLELAGYSTCYGVSSDEILRMLDRAGYDVAVFDPQTFELKYTATPWQLGVQNVLAVARSHRELVAQRLARAAEEQR